jgi:RNA polymerase sigma-70 factor (ECF subfamily)
MNLNSVEIPNQELLDACVRGEQKAQMRFYEKYYRLIYGTCLRIVHDVHLAEDMMQESFMKVFSSLKEFDTSRPLIPWMKKITIHQCIDHLKKRRIELFLDEEIEVVDEVEPINASDLPGLESIKKAIGMLSGGYQMILSLHLLEGYDHEEIGQILGIQSSTSRSQYLRAKRKLQGILIERSYV